MRVPFIDLHLQYKAIQPAIDQAISSVMAEGWFIAGDRVRSFEKSFADYLNTGHCVSMANGHDALCIGLRMLGVGPGDEVITTAFSWIATANAISQTGARPVFVDVDPENGLLDVKRIQEKITTKTKAIVPVHLYGNCADMDEIMDLAAVHGLFVVEDAAQAAGATYRGRKAGTIGHAGAFSFYPTKVLGAYGDAGCLVTNDPNLAGRCRRYANHGAAFPDHDYQFVGTNSRMDSLQAAVLNVKLTFLDSWIARRNQLALHYRKGLKDVQSVRFFTEKKDSHRCHYQFPVQVQNRESLINFLNTCEIGTSIAYPYSLPGTHPYFDSRHYPETERLAAQVLSLPLYPEMTESQVDYVCDKIQLFLK